MVKLSLSLKKKFYLAFGIILVVAFFSGIISLLTYRGVSRQYSNMDDEIIPSAMINAPSEIRCIGILDICIVASVANMVNSNIAPITSADRKPIKMNSVTMTINNAAITLATKFFTDASTILP